MMDPEPTHIHGFTTSVPPTRRLVGIEASQQGAFSPEAAEAVADALRAAAAKAKAHAITPAVRATRSDAADRAIEVGSAISGRPSTVPDHGTPTRLLSPRRFAGRSPMPNDQTMLTVARWRRNPDAATPNCPHCDKSLGIRLGMWRDNGRDAWLCDKCGEWEAVNPNDPRTPIPGEIWRNARGAIRMVKSVDDDGYLIMFARPAPAPDEWTCVMGTAWQRWVEDTGATRIKKASR